MTESPPVAAAEPKAPKPLGAQGLFNWLSTTDHKRIGAFWLRTSLVLLVASAIIGVVLGLERTDADSVDMFGGLNAYAQMWSLYRLGLVLLVVAPLFIGLATVVVPMQVGSTNIAFPRAALAAAWGYVLGAGITIVAVLAGGGWGALDGVTGAEADAMALTLLGTGMVIGSILLASMCIATTVLSLRTSGMTLTRVPMFAWAMLVTASVWILTLPVALANLALVYVDLRGGPLLFGDPQGLDMYRQIAWVIEQPQIYSFALPVLGVIGSVVPVVAGARQVAHTAMLALVGVAGFFSVGAWSQPYFSDQTDDVLFVVFALAMLLPVLGVLGGAAATLASGRAPAGLPPVHLVAAMGAGVVLLLAVGSGALRAIEPLDLAGTTVHTATLNLVVFAAVIGAVAGLWFWAPKIGGHLLSAGLGLPIVLALVGGAALLGGADLLAGFFDAPDVMVADVDDSMVDALVIVSLIGAVVIAAGVVGIVAAIGSAMRAGAASAGDDPWGGHSLEWATSSPPPAGNFAEAPAKVTSEAPLLDLADASSEEEDD